MQRLHLLNNFVPRTLISEARALPSLGKLLKIVGCLLARVMVVLLLLRSSYYREKVHIVTYK